MSEYLVSARKYRPSTFETVVGQRALTTTLKNAIGSGKLAHAYLFCGPRGVGKTTCARIFAKTINCLHRSPDGEACNECESCRAFNEQRSFNIHELDAASNNSVEDIRSLIEQVRVQPQMGRYKVFIIDEVHMLSLQAFNAFLKTLEEPPAHAIFILATTEKHKILPTILSRCQIYDFSRMEVNDIVSHLRNVAEKEGISYEEEALNVIAQKADGGMRDALSIFDQEASFTNGNITYRQVLDNLNMLDYEYYFRLVDAFLEHRVADTLLLFNEVLNKGFEGGQFVSGLASHLRDLLVSKDEVTLPLLEVPGSVRERYREQARKCSPKFLYRALKRCNTCDINYRTSNSKRLQVELALIEIAQEDDEVAGRSPAKRLSPIFNQPPANAATATPSPVRSAVATPANYPSSLSEQGRTYVPSDKQPAVENKPAETTVQAPLPPRTGIGFTPSLSGKIGTLSIRRHAADASAHSAQAKNEKTDEAAEKGLGEKAFEEKDLHYYWYQFANQLPQEEKAMAGRMKNITPHLLNDAATFEVVVDNEQVMEYLKPLTPRIESFLRQSIDNRHITMTIRVIEPQEQTRAYSKKEQLLLMEEKNRSLAKLQKALGLELA